jgi:hypothetical protein
VWLLPNTDAIGWQDGLVGAYQHISGAPESAEAKEQITQYRDVLKKLGASPLTPTEASTEGARYVTLQELRSRAP